MGWSFNSQTMSIGKSPSTTEHWTLAGSPKLAGSSPNVNGTIFGATSQIIWIGYYIFVVGKQAKHFSLFVKNTTLIQNPILNKNSPFTMSRDECSTEPAKFEAMQE